MLVYPVVIYKDEDSDYGVAVPDLPGCVSAGSTQAEALEAGTEAVYAHLEGLVLDGDPVPEPSALETLQAAEEVEEGFQCWAVVQIDPSVISQETSRHNVVLPKWLVTQIDSLGGDRSRFLTDAATRELHRRARVTHGRAHVA